jgi:uncharacterized repeat protein (TIGR03803 family)
LILSANTLYGTTAIGGSSGSGTVFALKTDGTGFTTLYTFDGGPSPGSDYAGLVLSDEILFGTKVGGSDYSGTLFGVNTDGTGFTTLYSFSATSGGNFVNSDGAFPAAGLALSLNTLYGTTRSGGDFGNGVVFAVNTDGTGFIPLHIFTAVSCCPSTNSDGAHPIAGLILSGTTLYGTASNGGSGSGGGTVFALSTDGPSFTTLHSFAGNDGSTPYARLTLAGNSLYGTTLFGGARDQGTIFKVNIDGTGFSTLHYFSETSDNSLGVSTNSDGEPIAGLIVSGDTLYGTAGGGGRWGSGTVFKVNTDGTGFTTLHSFSEAIGSGSSVLVTNSDGAFPEAGLTLSGNILYGTTSTGGSAGSGTVFSLTLPPPKLAIIASEGNVIVGWPTNATSFALQSAPTLSGTFTNIPGARSPYTNAIAGSQQFFRLSQ